MNGLRVGLWAVDSAGRHRFTYDREWMDSDHGRPISLSMPLSPSATYSSDVVKHFFENLLPDNDNIRARIQARYGAPSISAQDLLESIGRDCVGAITILPEGEEPTGYDRIEGKALNDKAVEQLLERTVLGPRHGGGDDDDFRISIAGAQEKTGLLRHKGKWMQPLGATPTTHIMKLPLGAQPQGIDLSTSVENEWLCARVLHAYDVPVAMGEMACFGETRVLVVPRFDRRLSEDGAWYVRLPQEDFAQVFGVRPEAKYESEGGPGIRQVMEQLLGSANALEDRVDLFRTQVLFWMLAAIDGHAKNFSIFIEPRGRYRLTPRYDVLSAYPVMGLAARQLSPRKLRMAMAVWGANRHYRWSDIQRKHFEKTALDCGLRSRARTLIDELVERTPQALEQVRASLPSGFPDTVSEPILAGVAAAAGRLANEKRLRPPTHR